MNEIEQQGQFLCDYATTLLVSGAPTVRIERSILCIAQAWGVQAEFDILPTNIIMTLSNGDGATCSIVGPTKPGAINLDIVSRLCHMSEDIAERGLDVEATRKLYGIQLGYKRIDSRAVVPLVGLANAGFCGIFGGDVMAMLIVVLSTMAGFWVKQWLGRNKVDFRLAALVSACTATVLSSIGYLLNISSTPDVALATSVLYLVPGIPFANSVSDFLYGHYLCAFSRFCNAMMITISLSLGLCLGLLIVHGNL